MLPVKREYIRNMLKKVYLKYGRSDIKTFEPFEYQQKYWRYKLKNRCFAHHIHQYDIQVNHMDFIILKPYIHILLHRFIYMFKYVPTF
jgi:hypothetical protein